MSEPEEDPTSQMTLPTDVEFMNITSPSVVELTEKIIEYKISVYIFTYATVPVAVWGWIGNFLSFR